MKQHAQLPLLTVMFLIGLPKHTVVVRERVGRIVKFLTEGLNNRKQHTAKKSYKSADKSRE